MSKVQLTNKGRIALIVLAIALIGGAIWKFGPSAGINLKNLGNSDSKYDAVLLVDTYTGWAPIVWGNGGKNGSK